MKRPGRIGRCVLALLAALAAACGGNSSGTMPTPTPVPTPATPIAPMSLGFTGFLTSVNAREWIATVENRSAGVTTIAYGTVVLPPDAGPDAGPLPVPGCPLLEPPPPGCAGNGSPIAVGETDWIYGEAIFNTPSGLAIPIQEAFGPQGESIELVRLASGDVVLDVKPGPGPIFIGTEPHYSTTRPTRYTPVYWPKPGLERAALPSDGFADGPKPKQADAQQRIVGAGVDPALPVLWLPAPDGYTLELLPLLDGGTHGGAVGIDDDLIVGWSDDASGHPNAVLWVPGDAGFAARALPIPTQATRCRQAIATSASRIAGECSDPAGGLLAVVWARGADGASWIVSQILAPLQAEDAVHVVAMSGDLVVGTSGQAGRFPTNVAWRLPPAGLE